MTHQELIAALEKATGPDRELDWAITRFVADRVCEISGTPVAFMEPVPTRTTYQQFNCPYWTASIDAAMTLVPEGLRLRLELKGANYEGWDAYFIDNDIREFHGRNATNAAIALCIAALRAHSKTEGSQND